MRIPELRKAVEIMDEDQLLDLATLYESLLNDENEGMYNERMTIVETEMDKDERPKVDRKLASKPGFWKGL